MFTITDLQHTYDEKNSDYGPPCIAAGAHPDSYKEIQAALESFFESKGAEIKSLTEERDKCKALAEDRYAFILKVEEALKNGASLDEVESILSPLILQEKTPEQQKQNEEIDRIEQELRDELDKRIAELEAKRAEINK